MSSFESVFSKQQQWIWESFARTLFTAKALKDFPLESIEFHATLSKSISYCTPQIRFFVKLALFLFQWGALIYRFKPFTRLTSQQQNTYFNKWFKSRFYLCYLFLRPLMVFVYTAYYAHPRVALSVGYKDYELGSAPKITIPSFVLNPSSLSREIQVEICVIGSGAGGAVVAKELAEKGHEVLILEEGSYFPLEYYQTMNTVERNSHLYRDGGMFATLGFPMILLPSGKGVGGTTLINSGTCIRTPDHVLNQWNQERGLSQLTPEHLRPYFERVESVLKIREVTEDILGNNNLIIKRGAEKLGLHGAPLIRNASEKCEGSGVCIFGCPTGAKQSMDKSYLPLAFKSGAKIIPNCHVERLHCQGDRVYKIEAYSAKTPVTIYPKKVVVAGGTLNSPLLLKRSHIGRRSHCLGKNLSIHPTAKIVGLFDELVDGFKGVPQGFSILDYEKEGILFESVFFPPWLLATSMYSAQEDHYKIMQAYRHAVIFGFLVHDESRGRVVSGPDHKPVVFYSIGKKEKELFVKGLKILGNIFFAAGAKVIYPTLRTAHEIHSIQQLEAIDGNKIRRRDLELAAFHPLGTCRMGTNVTNSVVDECLRIHELQNVWVADGSVFPTSLGVNPQISIMAFATRCADEIHRGS